MSMPPEASGPVLAASKPTRTGPLFWAKAKLGAVMLAILAPATRLTNCRREIAIWSSPRHASKYRLFLFFIGGVIYPMDVTNDQVITASFTWRVGNFGMPSAAGSLEVADCV